MWDGENKMKMNIDDMSTETIKKYLEKRESATIKRLKVVDGVVTWETYSNLDIATKTTHTFNYNPMNRYAMIVQHKGCGKECTEVVAKFKDGEMVIWEDY